MSWHVEPELLTQYQTGQVDRVTAASLESHVTACEQCRGLVAAEPEWLAQSWVGIAERVEPGRVGLIEAVISMVGVPRHVARLATLTPALRVSFVLAVLSALGFAAAAAGLRPEAGTYRIFLVAAPPVPVIGVAVAYGRHVDPGYEWALSSPIDTFRLLLLRSATVLAVSTVLGLLVWPAVPAPVGPTTWLLPSLALTLLTLTLASRIEIWMAATSVGLMWLVFSIGSAADERIDAFGGTASVGYLLLAVLASVVLVGRRDAFDREGGHR